MFSLRPVGASMLALGRAYVAVPVGHKLVVAFVAGAAAGWVVGPPIGVLQPLGELFIRALRFLVLPIVIATILAGLSTTSARAAARVGGSVILLYLLMALVASAIGVAAAGTLAPGVGMELPPAVSSAGGAADGSGRGLGDKAGAALGNGALLPVTFASVLLALTIGSARHRLPHHQIARWDWGVGRLAGAVYRLLGAIMQVAPVATFALIAVTFGGRGAGVAEHLARVFASVYVAQLFVVAALCMVVAASVPLGAFVAAVRAPLLTAFATGSSAATLPVEMETAAGPLRLNRGVFGFSLPLGVAINKSGTAVHLAVIAVFASHMSGAPLSFDRALAIAAAAALASVVTPPISGGSYVVMAGMLQDLALPLAVIPVVAGIPFLGKMNTPINSLGRLVGTQAVASWHERRDRAAVAVVAVLEPAAHMAASVEEQR